MLKIKSLLDKNGGSDRRFYSVAFLMLFLVAASSGGRMGPGGLSLAIVAPPPSLAATTATPSPVPPAEDLEVVDTFARNQTITAALTQHGFPPELIRGLVQTTKPVYDLSMVKAGQQFKLVVSRDGQFRLFNYKVDDERYLTVYRHEDHFVPEMKRFQFETRVEPVAGVIDESLFAAVTAVGEPEALANDLVSVVVRRLASLPPAPPGATAGAGAAAGDGGAAGAR